MSNTKINCFKRQLYIVLLAFGVTLAACDGGGAPGNSGDPLNRQPNALPIACSSADSDPDGDGWGWENDRSCKVAVSPLADGVDLPVGILYFIWHCITKTDIYQGMYQRGQLPFGEEFNTTNVLKGVQQDWGDINRFHWWDKPAEGYYCLGEEPDILRRHMAMLRDAGIDFLVVDITNHPNTAGLEAEDFILKSLRPLLEAAKSVEGAPGIVPWVPLATENTGTRNEIEQVCGTAPNSADCAELETARSQSMLDHVTGLLLNDYPDQVYIYDNKPLLLEAANDDRYPRAVSDTLRPELSATWTVKRTWGLQTNTGNWQFLSTCRDDEAFYNSSGWSEAGCNQQVNANEQISVAAGYQYTYISEPFSRHPVDDQQFIGGMPKFYGRTLAQQFRVAFEHRDIEPLVLVTGWNEWIASRFIVDGRNVFVDAYNKERNRDIEPGGDSGDYYYFLLRRLVAHYRAGDQFTFEDYFLTRESILDTDYYWESYQDLQNTFQQSDSAGLMRHWLTSGISEGRRPSLVFDASFYAQKYGDLASAGIGSFEQLLQHFLNVGFIEGRQGSAEFSAPAYIARYNKLKALFGQNGYYQAYRYYLDLGQHSADENNPSP